MKVDKLEVRLTRPATTALWSAATEGRDHAADELKQTFLDPPDRERFERRIAGASDVLDALDAAEGHYSDRDGTAVLTFTEAAVSFFGWSNAYERDFLEHQDECADADDESLGASALNLWVTTRLLRLAKKSCLEVA